MRLTIMAAGALAASAVTVGTMNTARAADDGATFGQKGQMAISWDQPLVAGSFVAVDPTLGHIGPNPMTLTPLGFQYYSVSNNGPSDISFSIAPAADFFIADNLSLGGQVMFGIISTSPPAGQQGSTTTLYGFAPQIGYNIGLSDSISFWPKVFFAFAGASTSNNGGSQSAGTIGLFAPFLFHLATHFYAGIGPDVSTQAFTSASAGNGGNAPSPPKVTTFGAMGTFGGWFNL